MSETAPPSLDQLRDNPNFGTLVPARLPEGSRARMVDSLYSGVYANSLSREEFDKQVLPKTDFDIANSTYDAFYKGKMDRRDFNKQIGFSSAAGSTRAAFMSGATLGLSDELGGAVDAVIGGISGRGFGDSYNRSVKTSRENAEIYRQNNPYIGRGVEIAGSLLSGGAGASASTAPISIARMAAGGAAVGGVAGAADAEGDIGNRLQGGLIGAGLGAVAPYAITAATRLATPIVRSVKNLIGMGNPEIAAQRQIGRTLTDAGMTVDDAGRAMAEFPVGKPAVLADVTGAPGTALSAVVANRPGAAMEMADQLAQSRRGAAPDRIAGDIDRSIARGSGRAVADATDELLTRRSVDAAPLYEQAFSQPVAWTDRLRNFLSAPDAREGLQRGLRIQARENQEQLLRGNPGTKPVGMDPAIQFAEDGTPKIIHLPNMRSMDAIKRGLDQMIESHRDQTTGFLRLTEEVRSMMGLRSAYVAELSKGNPSYGAARAAWAGPSESMDAIAMGRKIVTADRDVVARQIADMSPSEREFFRVGIARALTDRTSDPARVNSFVRRMAEDKSLAAKLQSSFDNPSEYAQFVKSLRQEMAMAATNQAISPRAGSQTARLLQGSDDLGGAAAEGMVPEMLRLAAQGGRVTAGMMGRLYGRGRVGTPAMAENIGTKMMTQDRDVIAAALRSVQGRQIMDSMDEQTRAQITRALLSGGAAAIPMQTN